MNNIGRKVLTPIVIAVAVSIGIIFICMNMRKGLWIDEFGPWVLLHDSFIETLRATLQDVYQSPLLYLCLWVIKSLFGDSEIALRSLSLCGVVLGLSTVYRIAGMLSGKLAGWISIALLASHPLIIGMATNIRPYGLCFASFCGTAFFTIRWLRDEKSRDLFGAGCFLLLTVYLHYLFIYLVALYGLALFFIILTLKLQRLLPVFLKVMVFVALGLVPVLHIIWRMWGRRASLSHFTTPTFIEFYDSIIFSAAILFLLGLLGRMYGSGVDTEPRKVQVRAGYWFLFFWMFAPQTLLFLVSISSSAQLFTPRFYFPSAIASAVIFGIFFARENSKAYVSIILAFVVFFQARLTYDYVSVYIERWREAAANIRESRAGLMSPVLVWSGDVESDYRYWLEYPARRAYFLGAVRYYKIENPSYPLPLRLESEETRTYLQEVMKMVEGAPELFLMSRFENYPYREQLESQLRAEGYRVEHQHFNATLVSVFRKDTGL